jgi:hypothetical protein
MGGTCDKYGSKMEDVLGFGGEPCGNEAALKTWT